MKPFLRGVVMAASSGSLWTIMGSFLVGFGGIAPAMSQRMPTIGEAWMAALGVLCLVFRIIFRKELGP